jgi:hypothetical protein
MSRTHPNRLRLVAAALAAAAIAVPAAAANNQPVDGDALSLIVRTGLPAKVVATHRTKTHTAKPHRTHVRHVGGILGALVD